MMTGASEPPTRRVGPRSLSVNEWPEADRCAWQDACKPSSRLKPGGSASYLAPVSRDDFARRYGAFLAFLQRNGRLEQDSGPAKQVTPATVEAYVAELKARVRSVTVYNCIYKLRRGAELIAPAMDFSWLAEIEKDLALAMEPRSKYDRLVLTDRLVDAGLTLITESQLFGRDELAIARGVRNGLIMALLAYCPIRLKNFAALEIGRTFKNVDRGWWIVLSHSHTKSGRHHECRVPELLTRQVELYLTQSRPVLLRSEPTSDALWISSTTGRPMTAKNIGILISRLTFECIGVDVSPHLFRTAAASAAAMYGSSTPHLASAVLGHTDPRVTEEHYNRATSMSSAMVYAEIVETLRRGD
jgi:integrase